MTYDSRVATTEVTVTENGEGKLIANVTKKENGDFTNKYRTELNYTAAGGLKLSKTLSGRPMTEGQFTFTVTPADEASANALGLHEGANNFKSHATAEVLSTGLTFWPARRSSLRRLTPVRPSNTPWPRRTTAIPVTPTTMLSVP